MASDPQAEDDLSPQDFLRRVREMTEERDREDRQRVTNIEKDILQSREQRRARRAGKYYQIARNLKTYKTVLANLLLLLLPWQTTHAPCPMLLKVSKRFSHLQLLQLFPRLLVHLKRQRQHRLRARKAPLPSQDPVPCRGSNAVVLCLRSLLRTTDYNNILRPNLHLLPLKRNDREETLHSHWLLKIHRGSNRLQIGVLAPLP
jgi:hypothetical protein